MEEQNQIRWNVHHRCSWSVLFAVPLEMLTISGDNRFSVVAALANYTRYL
jgi:hypothetical protein